MSDALIRRIANAIIDELFAQSSTHNNSPTAPNIWQYGNTDTIGVDGFVDALALARAVARVL
jgi:hypothetical protein